VVPADRKAIDELAVGEVPVAVEQAGVRGKIQMREREAVHSARDLKRVSQRDSVEMTGAERALPFVSPVVPVRKLKRRVLGDQRSELGERVVPAVGRHHVVCRLCAAVEPHDRWRPRAHRAEPVDHGALAAVAVAEIDDDDVLACQVRWRGPSAPVTA
jgi:hypothetical protein